MSVHFPVSENNASFLPFLTSIEHIAKHGRLQEAQARRLYWQVVSAVDYCHKVANLPLLDSSILFRTIIDLNTNCVSISCHKAGRCSQRSEGTHC